MSWLTDKADALERDVARLHIVAGAREEMAHEIWQSADEARAEADAHQADAERYRDLAAAIDADDMEAARHHAVALGLELRLTPDGGMEAVEPTRAVGVTRQHAPSVMRGGGRG